MSSRRFLRISIAIAIVVLAPAAGCAQSKTPMAVGAPTTTVLGGRVAETSPSVVPGGQGPTVSAEAAPLPTVPVAPPLVATPSTIIVKGAPTPTLPGGGAAPSDPGLPPPITLFPIVPIDDDPNLPLWCPLAEEVFAIFLRNERPGPDQSDRLISLITRSIEVAPAGVRTQEEGVLRLFDQLAPTGKLETTVGEEGLRQLADDTLGPGTFDRWKADLQYVLGYFGTNCSTASE